MFETVINFFKSDNGKLFLLIVIGLIIIGGIVGLSIFLWNRSRNNGASVAQIYVGKKIGELCTADAMCGTNKCRHSVCVI